MINQGVFPPQRYGRLRAKCTQSSTDAPAMATPVENTLAGTPVFAYSDVGIYTLTLTGLFTAGKTFVRVTPVGAVHCAVVYTSANVVTLNFKDLATPSAAESGDFDLDIIVYDV